MTYYQGFLGDGLVYQVPACLPKLILSFNLSLAINARVIYINFNYGIINIILALSERMNVQLANTSVTSDLYILTPVTESIVQFQYLGDQYYPPLTLLNVTIDLNEDFNTDLYQQFRTINKSATLQIKEIYPFTTTESQAITASSNLTVVSGGALVAGQAASSLAGGALSLSLVRMQIVGESVQMMRFFDIKWPANVNQFFSTSHIDPSSIVLPIDFTTSWNNNLNNRNTTIPWIFAGYEISPFFTENYNNEISNLMLLLPTVVLGSLVINLLRKGLQNVTEKMKVPKTNARKTIHDRYVICMRSFSRMMNRIDDTILWNFNLMFFLSIFQSGWLWALLNIWYSDSLLEPSDNFTKGSLVIAVLFLIFYVFLVASVFKVVLTNHHLVFQTKESLRPLYLKKYKNLFEDFDNNKKAQLLYVPFSLIRSVFFSTVAVLMTSYPFGQIMIVWSIDLVFIMYMIVYQPLKDRWIRRVTLAIELLTFGCMTLGLIYTIVDHFVDMDPITLDEIGFVFIGFSICSTFAGVIITLIQIVSLIVIIIQYLKKRKRMKNEVYPVSLQDYQRDAELTEKKEEVGSRRSRNETIIEKRRSAIDVDKVEIDNASLIKKIGSLSPEAFEKFEKTSEGIIACENIKSWWENSGLETTEEPAVLRPTKFRETKFKDRISLFNEEH